MICDSQVYMPAATAMFYAFMSGALALMVGCVVGYAVRNAGQ